MTTEIRKLSVGVPTVFRNTQNRSFLGVSDGPNAGTILIEYSADGVTYTAAPQGASLNPYSFCPDSYNLPEQGYVRITSAVAAAVNSYAMASDTRQTQGGVFGARQETVFLSTVPIASQIALTTEQLLWSMRFGAGKLPPSFFATVDAEFGCVNDANVKTLKLYMGPTGNAGTALASVAVTSLLNGRIGFSCYGANDSVTVKGGTVGSGTGDGGGAVALISTTVANWQQNEMELCITCTKATAAGNTQLNRIRAQVFAQ